MADIKQINLNGTVYDIDAPKFGGSTRTTTAPSASSTDATIPTSQAVWEAIVAGFGTNDAMVFKGTLGTDGTVEALPTTYEAGWTYKIITAGTYAGQVCTAGDMIIATVDNTVAANAKNAHWSVVQNNIDVMKGATSSAAGASGLVPAPAAAKQSSFLRGDGTWATPTNTKNTAGTTNKVATKLFLVGATEQSTNPTTYSNVGVYIGTDNCLYSNGTKVSVEGHTHSFATTTHKHTINSHTHGVTIPATAVTVTPTTTTVNSITSTGSLPTLTYSTESVGSASNWSAGTLPGMEDITYVKSGSTTAVLTGVKVTTQPTITLTANTATATGRITYVQSISGGSGSLIAYDAETNGTAQNNDGVRIPYVSSISKTTTSVLTGVKTSGTAKVGSETHTHTVTVSGTTENNSGSAVVAITAINAGSGALTSEATQGTGDIEYITGVTHTAATLGGTKTFVTGYNSFSGGSVSTGTTSVVNAEVTSDGVLKLTPVSVVNSVTHTAASLGTASTGTVTISGGGVTTTKAYLHHTHTGASSKTTANAAPHTHTHSYGSSTALVSGAPSATTTVATGVAANGTATVVTGVTPTTYYLQHAHNSATATTRYLSASASGTAVGADGTVNAYTGLTQETTNVATSAGTLPSLTVTTKSPSKITGWTQGELPEQGAAQTVLTGITAELPETSVTTGGSGTLTTNTPS